MLAYKYEKLLTVKEIGHKIIYQYSFHEVNGKELVSVDVNIKTSLSFPSIDTLFFQFNIYD